MASKSVASRLKGFVSSANDEGAGGYDFLGRLKDAGMFFATGQAPQRDTTNALDEQLKRQKLLTNSPEEKMRRAQATASAELVNKIKADEALIEAKRQRQLGMGGQATPQATTSGGQTFGFSQGGQPTPAFVNGQSPLGQMSGDKSSPASPYLQYSIPKVDPETGVAIPEYQLKENPAYRTPDEEAQMRSKEEMLRAEGLSQLQALRGAKKGVDFFGPMGGELPSTLAGFANPFVGTTYPGGSKISDRTDWEANLENLKATKMIETMMKMKDASKTGATGFGQLSEKEGQVLMDASMKLRRNLDPAQAKVYIDQMEAIKMKELGMPLSPEQQMILDQINSGTYPPSESGGESSVPSVGGTFQGKPIKNVRRIG